MILLKLFEGAMKKVIEMAQNLDDIQKFIAGSYSDIDTKKVVKFSNNALKGLN